MTHHRPGVHHSIRTAVDRDQQEIDVTRGQMQDATLGIGIVGRSSEQIGHQRIGAVATAVLAVDEKVSAPAEPTQACDATRPLTPSTLTATCPRTPSNDMNPTPRWTLLGLAVVLLLPLGIRAATPEGGTAWTPLFNGTDLSGWTVRCQPPDAGKGFWKADQGTILCDSMGRGNHNYVWLVSEREYGDFELRLRFQVYRDSPGNSGLQFRSRFDETANGGWLDGPQVDIHPPGPMTWRTGLIYDETRGEQRWVSPSLKDWSMDPKHEPTNHVFRYADQGDGWNELVLICQGTRVRTVVNGVVRTDWDGAGVLDNAAHVSRKVGRLGHLALQLHSGDELRIRFKDIQLRGL